MYADKRRSEIREVGRLFLKIPDRRFPRKSAAKIRYSSCSKPMPPLSKLFVKTICIIAVLFMSTGMFSVTVFAKGNFRGKTARPLRYQPDGTDFVIENGSEFFNRPLYGTNTAFRVDAGDRPEF